MMKTLSRKIAIILSMIMIMSMPFVLAACGGEDDSALVLSCPTPTIEIGQTANITIKGAEAGDATWASSDAGTVKVTRGVVAGIKLGSATITAKIGNRIGTITITVAPVVRVAVDSFSTIVEPEDIDENGVITLEEPLTYDIMTEMVPESNPIATSYTFASSDESKATVTAAGVVTFLKIGTVGVTITDNNGGSIQVNFNIMKANYEDIEWTFTLNLLEALPADVNIYLIGAGDLFGNWGVDTTIEESLPKMTKVNDLKYTYTVEMPYPEESRLAKELVKFNFKILAAYGYETAPAWGSQALTDGSEVDPGNTTEHKDLAYSVSGGVSSNSATMIRWKGAPVPPFSGTTQITITLTLDNAFDDTTTDGYDGDIYLLGFGTAQWDHKNRADYGMTSEDGLVWTITFEVTGVSGFEFKFFAKNSWDCQPRTGELDAVFGDNISITGLDGTAVTKNYTAYQFADPPALPAS